MKSQLKRTWAEIDLDCLERNYRALCSHVGEGVKFLGVVKGDAYGHGAVHIGRRLERLGAAYLAVSSLDEAMELRNGGIEMPILVLGHTPPDMVEQLIKYDITQTVSAYRKAEEYDAEAEHCEKKLRVHIKVDTGMSRLGYLVRGEHFTRGVETIANTCKLGNLDVEGIYTHLSSADMDGEEDEAYTNEQLACFEKVLQALEEKGCRFSLRHCANSGAASRCPKACYDMVRPGIALYGAGEDAVRMGLEPVMKLKSSVSTIKVFDADTAIGYGRTFSAAGRTRIGVLPIGYADGLFRALSNRASVQTAYGPAPIRGRICMDMTMVDLSELPQVEVGETVEIFGEKQRVDVLAELIGTIPYELLCAVSKRVPRYYYSKGEQVGYDLRLRD